ncbi:MAG: hypothetical protein ACI352_01140 [Elusimicrobiaceae bacterium]
MSGYSLGVSLGLRMSDRIPYKITLLIAFFFLLGLVLAIVGTYKQKSHYKELKNIADDIFAAEQNYFAKKGDYTADLRLLDFELPPSASEGEHSASKYVWDAGEEVLTPEMFSFTLKNGDSFLIEVIKDLNFTEDGKNAKYSVLEIYAFPKFKTLPASYSIRHFYDGYYPAGADLLKQCDISIQNAEKSGDDIKEGGKFCSRMGAKPTNIELIWLF